MNYLIVGKNGSGKSYFCVDMLYNLNLTNLANLKSNSEAYSQNYPILQDRDLNQLYTSFADTLEALALENPKVYCNFKTPEQLISSFEQFQNIEDGEDFLEYFKFHIIYNDFIKYVLKNHRSLKLDFLKPVHQLMADINGIKVDNVYAPPDDWRTAPLGSKIFYDEFQDRPEFLFDGNRPSKNPMILELSKIRHYDIDLFLMTPDPDNLHKSLRKIVHVLYFVKRPHGNPNCCSIYTFDQFLSNPRAAADSKREPKKYSEYKLLTYKKSIQRLYTSAANHSSMRFKMPWKWIRNAFFILIGAIIIISLLFKIPIFGSFADAIRGMVGKDNNLSNLQNASTGHKPTDKTNTSATQSQAFDPEVECRKGVNVEKPECVKWFDDLSKGNQSVGNSEHSVSTVSYNPNTPFNDESFTDLTYEVTAKPVFAGCAKFNGEYIAYTQQGTRLKVSQADCRRVINDGDRPFNYFAQKQEIKPVEQATDDHYKKAYQENIARLDAERYAKSQNPVVKPEQIPLGTPVPRDISGANSL